MYKVDYTCISSIHFKTSHMQSAIKLSLGLVLKFWASCETLTLIITLKLNKSHTIVCLLLVTKMLLVNLEQTSSCKLSTDHKLHSLLL